MKSQISRLMYQRFVDVVPRLPDHDPRADFGDIRTRLALPWLPLNISVPWQPILTEILSVKPWLVPHRDQYAEHRGWYGFCIHGKSYDAVREHSHYQDDRPCDWTAEAEQHMPFTVHYFRSVWPGSKYDRVRVMELAPGGFISLHQDTERAGMTPVNICITQPRDCNFVFETHGSVPFRPGTAFWLDVSNRHTVFNDSDQSRYHIIVHQDLDHPEFKKMVIDSYHVLYNHSEIQQ